MHTSTTVTFLVAVAALTLVGCGPSEEEPQASTSPPAPASPSPTASPSPSPTPVVAADGTDLAACADAECEVEITGAVVVEFDPEVGVDPVRAELLPPGADPEFGAGIMAAEPMPTQTLKLTLADATNTGVIFFEVGGMWSFDDIDVEWVAVTDDSAILRFELA